MNNERKEIFKTGMKLPEQFSQYFIGQAYLQPLTEKIGKLANVTFEPGCRNNWHIHHKGGQVLLCTEGTGWYQAWGEEAQKLTPGDVVHIEPGVKHWHGASKDSWFAHVYMDVYAEGSSVEWCEPVDDELYNKLK